MMQNICMATKTTSSFYQNELSKIKTTLLERLPRLNSIFSAKIENFSSSPPFVVILGSFVSEEPKFYHQKLNVEDYCAQFQQ